MAWFLDNPVPTYAILVQQAIVAGATAVVPALWHLEMANGLVIAERRHLLTATEAARDLGNLELLVSKSIETRGEAISLRRVFSTARAFTLTAYDSVYLDVAREQGIALASLDRALRAAASKAGIALYR